MPHAEHIQPAAEQLAMPMAGAPSDAGVAELDSLGYEGAFPYLSAFAAETETH